MSGLDPGLALILSDEQVREYGSLDSFEKRLWLRRYWKQSDPTPTTELNEWNVEFNRRVSMARSRFGSSGYPGWDSRGEIYVRFGEPDYRLVAPGTVESGKGLVPPEETWTYGRYGLVFRFEDRTLSGEYTFAFDPRDEQRARYQPWDETTPVDEPRGFEAMDAIDRAYTQGQLAQMETDGLKAIEFTPAEYHHDYGANQMSGWMEIAAFSDGHGGYNVEINREVDRGRIADAFQVAEQLSVVNRLAVYDSIYSLFSHRTEEHSFSPGGDNPAIFSDTVAMGSGVYWVAASLRIHDPPLIAIFNDEVMLKRRDGGEFWISDLAVKSRSYEVDGSTSYVARPSRIFIYGEVAVLVFEIYGIGTGGSRSAYEVRYALSPIDEQSGVLEKLFDVQESTPEVMVTYTRYTRLPAVREEVLLDTSELEHDNYKLVVTAKNADTGETDSRVATLRIRNRN